MIVGHKTYAGISSTAARSRAEQIIKFMSDLDTVTEPGAITEHSDGSATTHVIALEGLEVISADVNSAGEIVALDSRIYNVDGDMVQHTDMKDAKSGLWTSLRMIEAGIL